MIRYGAKGPDGIRHPDPSYPGEKLERDELPEGIQHDVVKLNSIIEAKYSREFLKICSFYNKQFPSLRYSSWTNSSYNVPPLTALSQERTDTGTGMATNYLKQIIDTITARLGTVFFHPKLLAEEPTFEYVLYQSEVERILRQRLQDSKFNRKYLECFHDSAILGYSYIFLNPYTAEYEKAGDYEVGLYESQLNNGAIKQFLYRNYAFPTVSITPYLIMEDEEKKKEILKDLEGKDSCDLKMYFDCTTHQCFTMVDKHLLTPLPYPFDTVLVAVFIWDVGFSKVTTTSLFDLLYPLQREINKINAKIQQLIRTYKGPVPVFASDVDLAMKEISDGGGECICVDSSRNTDSLCTVINPTPLDSQLQAEIVNRKTSMMELAGIQNISFDASNLKSAAALIALDQLRDTTFQAQLQGIAEFAKDVMRCYIKFMSKLEEMPEEIQSRCRGRSMEDRDWKAVDTLLSSAQLSLTPVHLTDSLNSEYNAPSAESPDYTSLQNARAIYDVLTGRLTYSTLPYYINADNLTVMVAVTLTKFDALGIIIPDTLHQFLLDAYIENIKQGKARL